MDFRPLRVRGHAGLAGLMPTSGNFHNSIPFARALLLVGLAALALFVVGPQAGSIDDDGDGNPDIPIVVSAPTLVRDVALSTAQGQRLQIIRSVIVPGFIAIPADSAGVGESDFVSLDSPSGLRSSVLRASRPLRC